MTDQPAGNPTPAHHPGQASPGTGGSPVVPALVGTLFVLVAAAIAMASLWLGALSKQRAAEARLDEVAAVVAGRLEEAKQINLATDTTRAERTRLWEENTAIQEEVDELRGCSASVREALDAAARKDEIALNRAVRAMVDSCSNLGNR